MKVAEITKKASNFIRTAKTIVIAAVLISVIIGVIEHWRLKEDRHSLVQSIAKTRGTAVITMVHRQETVGLLGIPVKQYIQVEDAESVLRSIRSVPDGKPIDFIIHTPGGILFSAYQIARALKAHKGKVTVFVPHYALSGGTIIALAADQIVMDKDAILGPVDPQLIQANQSLPAASLVNIPKLKSWEKIDDYTVVMIDQAEKSLKQIRTMVESLLQGRLPSETVNRLIDRLTSGSTTHDYPLFPDEAKELGLPVSTDMPENIYKLMELYPQPS